MIHLTPRGSLVFYMIGSLCFLIGSLGGWWRS